MNTRNIVLFVICTFLSISAYSQDIAALKAEVEALKTRVTALELIINEKIDTTKISKDVSQEKRCVAITAAGTQCSRKTDVGSEYCWQHKKSHETTSSATNSKSSTLNNFSTTRDIQTGPRGGQYYINSKGNKVYVKKK